MRAAPEVCADCGASYAAFRDPDVPSFARARRETTTAAIHRGDHVGRGAALAMMGTVKRAAWDAAHGPGRCVAEDAADFDPAALDRSLAIASKRRRRAPRATPRTYAPPRLEPTPTPPPVDNGPLWCLVDRGDVVSNLWIAALASRGLRALALAFGALGAVIAYEAGAIRETRPAFLAMLATPAAG